MQFSGCSGYKRMQTQMTLEPPWQVLCDLLLGGKMIPFLGAGASAYSSDQPGGAPPSGSGAPRHAGSSFGIEARLRSIRLHAIEIRSGQTRVLLPDLRRHPTKPRPALEGSNWKSGVQSESFALSAGASRASNAIADHHDQL